MKFQRIIRAVTFIAVAFALAPAAQAENYPSKSVFMKVAYPAGGPTDAYARRLQTALQAELKQTVVIENLPGAGGAIAAQTVGRLAPNGYTLLATSGSDIILTPLTNAGVQYKPQDFRIVAQFFASEWVLLVRPSMPAKTVDEFIEYARKSDPELTFASWGYGSSPHLLEQEFARLGGFKALDVPYKGAASIVADLISGQVDAAFFPLFGAPISLIETGKVKAIGIAASKRNQNFNEISTLNSGKYIKGFYSNGWSGMFVRRDTPEEVVLKLNSAINKVVRSADYQAYLKDTGAAEFSALTPVEASAFWEKELKNWTGIATRLGIKPQ